MGFPMAINLKKAGFEVVDLWEFNRLGVYGWWVSKQLQNETLSPRQMKLYEWLLPIAKVMDYFKLGPGLSVIGVGRKSDTTVPTTPQAAPEQSVLQTAQ